MTSRALVLRGDARALPLPDACVDLVVTSPPYYSMRSYLDNGEHYDGQIGSEPTAAEYIAELVRCTREWMRVLKPTGSIWVNLGDKYAADGRGPDGSSSGLTNGAQHRAKRTRASVAGVRRKSLLLLPERYRIACVDELRLIARAVVVWSKPNGVPESVTDRVRRSHEDWVCIRKTWPDEPCPPDLMDAVLSAVARHEISVECGAAILSGEPIPADGFVHLVNRPQYFSAVDEIRQPHSDSTVKRAQPHRAPVTGTRAAYQDGMPAQTVLRDQSMHALGALPGSVWQIPTEPLTVPDHLGVDHFAAFPTEWPRRIIAGWSPSGICTACGEGRRPTVATEHRAYRGATTNGRPKRQDLAVHNGGWNGAGYAYTCKATTITGEACACPEPTAPTRAAIVLDPFGGTGTTVLVARALGRIGISVDMSADYCRIAQWRTSDPGQLAKVLGVSKPPAEVDGQANLFPTALFDWSGA